MTTAKTFGELLGHFPHSDDNFKHQMRRHQAWYRAGVLCEAQGDHPKLPGTPLCSQIAGGATSGKNFVSQQAFQAAMETLVARKAGDSPGLIDEGRLFNNLLSSQPLAFNFFGHWHTKPALFSPFLKRYLPDIEAVEAVDFEYAPAKHYTSDNSAFDVAFHLVSGGKKGVLGLECKYTDSFSSTEYDKPMYHAIFEAAPQVFSQPYKEYTKARFNQLFRNQLIAEAMQQRKDADFAVTGLFCHPDDSSAIAIGQDFQQMLANGKQRFLVITYRDFISAVQQVNLTWEDRTWSMLLWARYCATELSKNIYESCIEP